MPLATQPELSVVIPSYNAADTIVDCLESLKAQKTERRYEIIVVDSSSDNTAKFIGDRFPGVRLLSFSDRKYCGDARNIGVAAAAAPIIAFLDADCTVGEEWIEQIAHAHQGKHGLIGCSIVNGSSRNLSGWAYYFCEFNLWLPAGAPREIPEIAGCALSMKKHIFDRYGPFIEGTYCSDTAWHWKLCQNGIRVLFLPTVQVQHTANCTCWSMLAHIYSHRRQFARVMVREKKLRNSERYARLLLCLPLPMILFPLLVWRVLKSRRFWREFAASSFLVFAALTARAAGEFSGFAYLSEGRADNRR